MYDPKHEPSEEIKNELEEISPSVSKWLTKTTFEVPSNEYFQNLTIKVLEESKSFQKTKEAKVLPFRKMMMIAASITMIISAGLYFLYSSNNNDILSDINSEEIEKYIINNPDEFSEEEIFSLYHYENGTIENEEIAFPENIETLNEDEIENI
jgi:hypothetical protein